MIPNAKSEDIRKFWRHVLGGESGLLHVWTGKRDAEGVIDKETIVSNSFNYPDAAASAATWALKKSSEGREVYFCAHLLTNPRRIKENAAPVRSLWGDLDGAPVPNGELKPTAVVESSPGRYHCYWRLDSEIPPDVAEDLNKRIAAVIGADPSGFDRTQLLRVPDTTNHKYPDAPVVALKDLAGGRSYSPADLDNLLPTSEKPKTEYQPDDGGEEPPVVLSPEARKVWRGESPKLKEGGEVDRSATLLCIGRVLYDAGGNRRVVAEGVSERDRTLGFCKYSGNRDGGQREYERVFEKLEESGRNSRVRVTFGGEKPAAKGALPEMDEAAYRGIFGRIVETVSPQQHTQFNLTDLGNAERFVAQFGQDVRYCYPWAKWLTWTGSKWARDDAGRVHRLAKETVRSVYGEAATAEDEARRKALAKHAASSEAKNRIEAMLELAKSDVPVSPDELDADPDLLNASNGTINLRTGELRPHRREDLLTKIAGADYDPDAPAPAWEAFLERVLPGDELRRFVRRAAGYSATGDTSEQVMFINHGVGANGKSTFQEALSEALGDYSMRAPTEMLMVKRSGGVPNDVARLKGARFVSASETEQGRHLAESLVKDLTGTDTITARFMRAEFFDFEPTHKLWLSTNHKPIIRGTDLAIWRRIRLVPWAVTIPPQEQNKQLSSRIQDELPGVLSWVVRGCLDWRREGLAVPDEVRKATGDYRSEMDTLGDFLEDSCVVDPDTSVAFNNLWKAYREWCLDTEEKGESKKQFGMSLTERGFVAHKGSRGVRIRRGLRLKEDLEPDSEKRSATGVADDLTCATQEMSCKPAENAEGVAHGGPDLHMNARKLTLREVNTKTEPHAPHAPPEPVSFDLQARESVTVEEDHILGLIANPPEWLSKQLGKCRTDPARFLKPTCAAIALDVFSTAARWPEVEPVLRSWLEAPR